jgi:hypothetical protein
VTSTAAPSTRYDPDHRRLLIANLVLDDEGVVTESRRWSTGTRASLVEPGEMVGTDLCPFVRQAVLVGSRCIAIAGGLQETFDLQRLITDVASSTAASVAETADATRSVVNEATDAVARAAHEAKQAIDEAGSRTRKAFADNVDAARRSLGEEITRLVGGDQPELLSRLTPLLDTFGRTLQERAATQTSELIDKVTRQFDPADPTSPLSKQNAELARQQAALAETVEKSMSGLSQKVDELRTAVTASDAASPAVREATNVTPLKGIGYAQGIHTLMEQIASGLGDEYLDTSAETGRVPRSKKGDGVLSVDGGTVRIVLEMTDSARPGWNSYLAEAERNRDAIASLGLVRSASQLGGHSIEIRSARRIIMAFDPAGDDPQLLRTVIQLIRLSAMSASARHDAGEIHTAQEKLTEAAGLLVKVDEIRHAAGLIRGHSASIERDADVFRSDIARLLAQAQSALGAASDSVTGSGAA